MITNTKLYIPKKSKRTNMLPFNMSSFQSIIIDISKTKEEK